MPSKVTDPRHCSVVGYAHACGFAFERAVADPLHRRRIDTEPLGDLANAGAAGLGQRGPYGVFHPFGYRRPPQAFALTTGPRNPGADSFLNHRPLKLGENAHHLKHRLARRRGGVDALLVKEKIDPERV